MKLSGDLRAFQHRLGHAFARPDLLVQAVTHPSVTGETRADNQRLEFLGDRVLNLVIAEALFEAFPEADEGTLAPRYNALVRKETCAEIAREIGLGEVLRLGRGEMLTGGRRRDTGLGDAMEAVIAAVYLDAGLAPAAKLVRRLWGARIETVEGEARDPKSALQEWTQARGLGLPAYDLVSRKGPDHALVFTVEARLENGAAARATGSAKRTAEREAARALLERLEQADA